MGVVELPVGQLIRASILQTIKSEKPCKTLETVTTVLRLTYLECLYTSQPVYRGITMTPNMKQRNAERALRALRAWHAGMRSSETQCLDWVAFRRGGLTCLRPQHEFALSLDPPTQQNFYLRVTQGRSWKGYNLR